MATKVIGLGTGGHAKVVLEILRSYNSYELTGMLDPKPELQGKNLLGVPVLGNDDLLPDLKRDGIDHFFVGLGSIGDTGPRRRLFELALEHGMKPIEAIHPQAIISTSAELGGGVTVMGGAVINASASLGMNVIINTGAIIEHDCVVGNHVHIATGAKLASTVNVGDGAHIGIGANILQCIRIGKGALIGAGSVVIRDVPANVTAAGCPAQVLPSS